MKNPRLALSVLLVLTLNALPALRAGDQSAAPVGGERLERFQENADRMAEALGLTADQKARMQAINQQERAELEALRANAGLAKEERRALAKEIHRKYREQRHALMTPEQRAKAETMRGKTEKRLERREERREKAGA